MKHNTPSTRTPQIRQPFEQIFNDFFGGLDSVFGKDMHPLATTRMPAANVMEDENAFHIELMAPGWDKADFSIKLDNNLLRISAEKTENSTDKNSKYHRREFKRSSFKRDFSLPKRADKEGITAKYEGGILRLSIPKLEVKDSTKQISIL